MKAIGARRRDIRRIYLRTALLLGALGALLGAALGRPARQRARRVLRVDVLRHRRRLRRVGPGRRRERRASGSSGRRWRRCRRSAARRGCRSTRRCRRPARRSAARAASTPLLRRVRVPAAQRADRPARARPAQAAQRSPPRCRSRSPSRRCSRCSRSAPAWPRPTARLVRRQPLRRLDPGRGEQAARRRRRPPDRVHRRACATRSRGCRTTSGSTGRDAAGLGPARAAADEHAHRPTGAGTPTPRSAHARRSPCSAPTIAKTHRQAASATASASSTGSGPATLRVIGISGNQANNGDVVFTPVDARCRSLLGSPGRGQQLLDHDDLGRTTALIDRTTTRVEDTLAAHGNQVGHARHATTSREKQIAANAHDHHGDHRARAADRRDQHGRRSSTPSPWRCSSARARSACCAASAPARATSARIFATEGLVVAVAGWLLGVPLGYAARARASAGRPAKPSDSTSRSCSRSPTPRSRSSARSCLALVVMLAPLRRAVRFKPGEAIRYA